MFLNIFLMENFFKLKFDFDFKMNVFSFNFFSYINVSVFLFVVVNKKFFVVNVIILVVIWSIV